MAVEEFREHTVTERESWILGNVDANPSITVEENAALIEPGLEFGNQAFRDRSTLRSKACLTRSAKRMATAHGRRRFSSTIASPTQSSSRSSSARRTTAFLPPRTSTATTSPMLPRRRWAASASRPAPTSAMATRSLKPPTAPRPSTPTRTSSIPARSFFRRHAAGLHRLERSRQAHRNVDGKDDSAEVRDVRLRTPDRRRHQSRHQRVRHTHHRQYVKRNQERDWHWSGSSISRVSAPRDNC